MRSHQVTNADAFAPFYPQPRKILGYRPDGTPVYADETGPKPAESVEEFADRWERMLRKRKRPGRRSY